MRIRDGG